MLEERSALDVALRGSGRVHGQAAGVVLGEVKGFRLMQASAFPSSIGTLEGSLASVLGMAAPARIERAARSGEIALFRTGPEQFWIVAPRSRDDVERSLATALHGQRAALTSLSHSRLRIFIEGPAARQVLMKNVPIDFYDAAFPVDAVAITGVHHTPVLIHRIAGVRYEVYAMRTFALSVWEVIVDAALEFGYEIRAS
jgi:heterotetrameric sarcosine oxidase gamma subunit